MKVRITLIVADDSFDRIDEIVRESVALGLNLTNQIGEMGLVMGEISSARVNDLRNLKGVMDVELDISIQLPPQ